MKLIYDLQIMNVDDEMVAIPVGDNAKDAHMIIKLNETSKQIIDLIKESNSPDEVLQKLCLLYPEESKNDIGNQLCDFLNQLIKEGLLIP